MRLQRFSHFQSEIGNAKIENIQSPVLLSRQLTLDIKRDDLIHPIISGNKYRKLKYLIAAIQNRGFTRVAVMGGPYSNLLQAIAYLAYRLNWQATLYVRGFPEQKLSPILKQARDWGAEIVYVSRLQFQHLRNTVPKLEADVFWISEGGFHPFALSGCMETVMELPNRYDYIVMASATGASIAGLYLGCQKQSPNTQVIGISVLKNSQQQLDDIVDLLNGEQTGENDRTNKSCFQNNINVLAKSELAGIKIVSGFEFGGYAKSSPELDRFVKQFQVQHSITIEPVYTGKSFYATLDLCEKGFFKTGSKILLIHCGGIQTTLT
ncbi:1-aminocyclopropane-1-carboxylate deaminase/D-cysteine desulfhydrase [Aliikangiella sp. IMCC44653]